MTVAQFWVDGGDIVELEVVLVVGGSGIVW